MDDQARLQVITQDGGRESDGQSGKVKQISDYSKWNMVWICVIVAACHPSHKYITQHASSPYFMAYGSLLFLTFLADLALVLSKKYPYISVKILIYTISILTMLTSISLLLLLNPSYAMVTNILALPNVLIIILIFYKGLSTGQAHDVIVYEAYLSELKPFFDISTLVTSSASRGMVATIFGYFKNFPTGDQVDAKFPEAFMFFTIISGLLVMLLTTEPPSLPHPTARSRFITFIKVLRYSLFGLLALAVLAVAAEFSGLSIFLAFVPIFLAVVVRFRMEFIQEDGRSQARIATGHESEPDTHSITITTSIFGVLMVIYSVHFSSEHHDFHLQTSIFFMSSAFMSGLSWTLLAYFRPPRTQSLAMAMMVLSYSNFGLSVVAILDVIVLMIRTG